MPSADDLAERQAINKIGSNDVYVRAAKIADSAALIKLNEEFRENMLRWQQEDDDAEYPALDFDDVEFILTEEDNQNLIVLCEKPGGGRRQARIIGYSYAYEEPWDATDEGGKKDKGKGKSKPKKTGGTKGPDAVNSLYIAEMFVAKSERGRGLGDVLLFETLNRRCKTFPRSHLYVSSRNTTAVAIYYKFGFLQSDKPSGDISHDLVLEMKDTKRCVTAAARRLKEKFKYAPDYDKKCDVRTFSPRDPSQPRRPREPSPEVQPKRVQWSGKSPRTRRSKRKSDDDDGGGTAVRRCLEGVSSRVFAITGVVQKDKLRKMEAAIESLGGDVLIQEGFSEACTHVISPKPLLTEKFLCGLAAGKILVHDSYLWESHRAGHLLDESPFEWASISRPSSASKVKAEMDSVSRELAKAVYKRRAAQQQNEQIEGMGGVAAEPPFKGMVVMLLVSDDKRRQLHNLLLAGGADLCPDIMDVCSGAKTFNPKTTTHAFVSPSLLDSDGKAAQIWSGGDTIRRQARKVMRDLEDHGVRCLREEFIVDMLIEGPSLSRRPYQISLPEDEDDDVPK